MDENNGALNGYRAPSSIAKKYIVFAVVSFIVSMGGFAIMRSPEYWLRAKAEGITWLITLLPFCGIYALIYLIVHGGMISANRLYIYPWGIEGNSMGKAVKIEWEKTTNVEIRRYGTWHRMLWVETTTGSYGFIALEHMESAEQEVRSYINKKH